MCKYNHLDDAKLLFFSELFHISLGLAPFNNIYYETSGNNVTIKIVDFGKGMTDVEKAMEPLYTSRPDLERSGMGFTVMETFMDTLEVTSEEGKGTTVIMSKKFN